MKMKYEKPEAEVVEFKALEANAAQGLSLDSENTSVGFSYEENAGPRV